MENHLEKLIDSIQASTTLSDSEKQLMFANIERIEKASFRMDFKLKRTLKDKSIVINVLNATIKDLEKSKLEIELTNKQLLEQQEALKKQKEVVEQQSISLKENLNKLELSYRELEQFSYVASHDLKSPLRTIASFAQLLKRKYYEKLDQDANDFIEYIVSGVNHMSGVINGLLEYSKVGNAEGTFEEVNLNDTLEIVKFNLKRDIEESKANILYPELPMVLGNSTNLIRLFQNLISNAIKFKKPHKTPEIRISFKGENQYWQINLEDNGVGMEVEFKNKAFLPFQRLNYREKPGLGMGLAICKKIVEIHKGYISYKSSKNNGTSFIFTLPKV